jgi:hypothetical protein
MVRTFVTLDGEILGEEEWNLSPLHSCFFCGSPLIYVQNEPCPSGFLHEHQFVEICDRNF